MQFLAEHFNWGIEEFNEMPWRMRKEFIQFHIDVLENRKQNNG